MKISLSKLLLMAVAVVAVACSSEVDSDSPNFKELIEKAHSLGIKILMDLVVNHCSDEHEWFKKACEDPEGKYGKYFYFLLF